MKNKKIRIIYKYGGWAVEERKYFFGIPYWSNYFMDGEADDYYFKSYRDAEWAYGEKLNELSGVTYSQ